MRIISGSARGRKLSDFSGQGIRPTPDRVREALFSKLTSRIGSFNGHKVLELFAGSGAQSLEALSRGAASAILVDSSSQAIKVIEENIARCKFTESASYLQADVLSALPRLQADGPFDLILLDPPYHKGLIPQALEKIEALQLLAADGIICAESAADEVQSDCGEFTLLESRKYGSTRIHLYCRNDQTED